MLVSRDLQEQRKQSYLTLAKENQSPLGLISKSSGIFLYKSSVCASNSGPAFCFVLSPRPTSSAGTASAYDSQQTWEKSVYYVWNMDIFLTKLHWFATGGLYSPPGAVWGMFYYECVLYLTCFGLLNRNTSAMITLRTIFNITPIGFIWKKKVLYT